tara:strand:- start:356 stop:631 length:276 start_codon:yes stop_codon:yes gene_type:complete
MRNSKKQPIIDYVLEKTDESLWEHVKNQRIKQKKGDFAVKTKTDNVLKYCYKCGLVWQKLRKMYKRPWMSYPKGHIPSYGKERLLCPNCEK